MVLQSSFLLARAFTSPAQALMAILRGVEHTLSSLISTTIKGEGGGDGDIALSIWMCCLALIGDFIL